MSMRSLFEFNHDKTWRIEKEPQVFLNVMERIFCSGRCSTADEGILDFYGVTYYGSQHHSTPCRIEWDDKIHATGVKPKVIRHSKDCTYGTQGADGDWCTCQGVPYRP